MSKFLIRIVALLLVPCLVWGDFGSRISILRRQTSSDQYPRHEFVQVRLRGELFSAQAMADRGEVFGASDLTRNPTTDLDRQTRRTLLEGVFGPEGIEHSYFRWLIPLPLEIGVIHVRKMRGLAIEDAQRQLETTILVMRKAFVHEYRKNSTAFIAEKHTKLLEDLFNVMYRRMEDTFEHNFIYAPNLLSADLVNPIEEASDSRLLSKMGAVCDAVIEQALTDGWNASRDWLELPPGKLGTADRLKDRVMNHVSELSREIKSLAIKTENDQENKRNLVEAERKRLELLIAIGALPKPEDDNVYYLMSGADRIFFEKCRGVGMENRGFMLERSILQSFDENLHSIGASHLDRSAIEHNLVDAGWGVEFSHPHLPYRIPNPKYFYMKAGSYYYIGQWRAHDVDHDFALEMYLKDLEAWLELMPKDSTFVMINENESGVLEMMKRQGWVDVLPTLLPEEAYKNLQVLDHRYDGFVVAGWAAYAAGGNTRVFRRQNSVSANGPDILATAVAPSPSAAVAEVALPKDLLTAKVDEFEPPSDIRRGGSPIEDAQENPLADALNQALLAKFNFILHLDLAIQLVELAEATEESVRPILEMAGKESFAKEVAEIVNQITSVPAAVPPIESHPLYPLVGDHPSVDMHHFIRIIFLAFAVAFKQSFNMPRDEAQAELDQAVRENLNSFIDQYRSSPNFLEEQHPQWLAKWHAVIVRVILIQFRIHYFFEADLTKAMFAVEKARHEEDSNDMPQEMKLIFEKAFREAFIAGLRASRDWFELTLDEPPAAPAKPRGLHLTEAEREAA